MKTDNINYNISYTTSNFIQALNNLKVVEVQLIEGFRDRYGEESSLYDKSGLPEIIEELKSGIKTVIGDSIEITLGENWHTEERDKKLYI